MNSERVHIIISGESQYQECELLPDMKIDVQHRTQGTVFLRCNDNASHVLSVHASSYAHAHIVVLAQGATSMAYRSTLAKGAQVHWHIITLNAPDSQHDLVSQCEGDDATSTVDWIFLAKDSEKMNIAVQNVFLAKRGGGEVTMKGVVEGKGNVSARGLIKIGPAGGQTNTYLTQDVLMLDPTAKVDAIPALEIKTNDVKASHSATVSRVTEEDLFYFAARGIDAQIARSMYVQGFLDELLIRIPNPAIQEKVEMILQEATTSR